MQVLVFLDLDDTLFHSRAKCPEDQALSPVAYLPDGSAHSWMSARQQALWGLLEQGASLIPTTARDLGAFKRVDLPFTSWRILDHGGVILNPQDQPDPDWLVHSAEAAAKTLPGLAALLALTQDLIARKGLAVRARIIVDFDIPFYLVAKYRGDRTQDLDRLQSIWLDWVQGQGDAYRLYRNGNNLVVLPRWLGKEYAVRALIARLRPALTLGIGDSLSDADFLAECDYAVLPRASQLFAAGLGALLRGPKAIPQP
ncbi:haloacid dehalogenase [Caldichromatium japonicum]|uniref:Haloacid dehalogenase n=1 Tax=Caldichromatium japonicum TaxID=2699430 RepID=A0A6G7VFS3_9GAMM|nr:haloacid dehalogenase [Caldichromatium japonicum]QIK38726.1 haloacid dehalogenase [Caldichromatium japonicum]